MEYKINTRKINILDIVTKIKLEENACTESVFNHSDFSRCTSLDLDICRGKKDTTQKFKSNITQQ